MKANQASIHYDEHYFEYQQSLGEFGGWANSSKFNPYIHPSDRVLDFGCGGGYLLKNLSCVLKIGVEINPYARDVARTNGVDVYASTQELPDESVDVIISNHALEHTQLPLVELQQLYRVLVKGGRVVIFVPCESVFRGYRPDNEDHHLYSWSPMCLGNLLTETGFERVEASRFMSRYPPKVYKLLPRIGGRPLFEAASVLYGWLNPALSQSKGTGFKPRD